MCECNCVRVRVCVNSKLVTHTDDDRDVSREERRQNAGISLGSPCIPPVNTVPHGGYIVSLWERIYRRRGLMRETEGGMHSSSQRGTI